MKDHEQKELPQWFDCMMNGKAIGDDRSIQWKQRL